MKRRLIKEPLTLPPVTKPPEVPSDHIKAGYRASIVVEKERRHPYVEANSINQAMRKLKNIFGNKIIIESISEVTDIEIIK